MSGKHIDTCREQISELNKPNKSDVAEVLNEEFEHIHDNKAIELVEQYIASGDLVLDNNQNIWIAGKEPPTYEEWINILRENENLTALEVVDVLVSERPNLTENDAYDLIEYGLNQGIIVETDESPRGTIQPGSPTQSQKSGRSLLHPIRIMGYMYIFSFIIPFLSPRIHYFIGENPITGEIMYHNSLSEIIDYIVLGAFPTSPLDILLFPLRHHLQWILVIVLFALPVCILALGILLSTDWWKHHYNLTYRIYIFTCILSVIYMFLLFINTPYAIPHVGALMVLIPTVLFSTITSNLRNNSK